jgi:hypothetical protein
MANPPAMPGLPESSTATLRKSKTSRQGTPALGHFAALQQPPLPNLSQFGKCHIVCSIDYSGDA